MILTFNFSGPGYGKNQINLGLYEFYGYVMFTFNRILKFVKLSIRYSGLKFFRFLWNTLLKIYQSLSTQKFHFGFQEQIDPEGQRSFSEKLRNDQRI